MVMHGVLKGEVTGAAPAVLFGKDVKVGTWRAGMSYCLGKYTHTHTHTHTPGWRGAHIA
jgi:hypothetical protein